jgi:hypothetical protein
MLLLLVHFRFVSKGDFADPSALVRLPHKPDIWAFATYVGNGAISRLMHRSNKQLLRGREVLGRDKSWFRHTIQCEPDIR